MHSGKLNLIVYSIKKMQIIVIVSGLAAEHCVLFTYNGALERGYDASILQHEIAGFDKIQVKETQYLRSTTSNESLNYFIKQYLEEYL